MSFLDRVLIKANNSSPKGWLWRDFTVSDALAIGSMLLGTALMILAICLWALVNS